MKNKRKQEEIRQLTPEEFAEEERKLQRYRKIIKVLWMEYGISAIMYISNGLIASTVTEDMQKPEPITTRLSHYRNSVEYNDYISYIQREIVAGYENGEIDIDEFDRLMSITKDEEHFEQFLRSLDDRYVQRIITETDNLEKDWQRVGQTYAGLNIASLTTLMGATIPMAVFREKEDGIEEARKKRAEKLSSEVTEMGE